MLTPVKIVAFAGSTREGSYNRKLLQIAVEAARAAGTDVEVVDLKAHPLPLYDGDLEKAAGIPDEARRLKKRFAAADGFLIASPEYNSSFSGVLKNFIDWLSRPEPGESPLVAFKGKGAALMAASPGGLGGYRGLTQLRWVLMNIGVHVLPDMVSVPQASEAFAPDGRLADARKQASVEALGTKLADFLRRLRAE